MSEKMTRQQWLSSETVGLFGHARGDIIRHKHAPLTDMRPVLEVRDNGYTLLIRARDGRGLNGWLPAHTVLIFSAN